MRWVGSKRLLAAKICSHLELPHGTRYYEPFAGSAAMFFALEPPHGVIADFNHELIHAYRQLRDRPGPLLDCLFNYEVTEDHYYQLRAAPPTALDERGRAARFFFLNRFCFNGVYRTNQKGQFNVPMGRKTGGLPPRSDWMAASAMLQRCELRAGDFRETLSDAKSGDFIYLDPPYSEVASRHRGEFGYGGFSDDDIEALILKMRDLDRRSCRVMVSFKHAPEFASLSAQWRVDEVTVDTRVAANVSARQRRSELLLTNFELQEKLR